MWAMESEKWQALTYRKISHSSEEANDSIAKLDYFGQENECQIGYKI